MNEQAVSNIVNNAIQTYANTVGAVPGYEVTYYYSQIVAAFITFFGFIAVGIQLWYTRKSVNAANESAKAAKSAADATKEQVSIAQKQIQMAEQSAQDTKTQMDIMLHQAEVDIASKMIATLPLFRIEIEDTFRSMDITSQVWEVTLRNVGHGPAFNIVVALFDGPNTLDQQSTSMITATESDRLDFNVTNNNKNAKELVVSYVDFHGFMYSQKWTLRFDDLSLSRLIGAEMKGRPVQVGKN